MELVGICFDPNVEKCGEGKLRLPKQDKSLGDKDDFMALKRLIDDAILSESLAKSVSIHNFSALCSLDKPDIVHCLWPTPNVGYKGVHLLKILNTISQKCYENSASLEKISLIGFSTDSAGFSLAASVINMTPSDKQIEQGFYFLSLGIDEERFLAPYFSDLPFISFLDHDHERRLFLKCLKYKTLDLYIWRDDMNGSCWISIEHLKELREISMNDVISCGFSALDLELSLFFDQNTDAADRVFRLEVADMLDRYVPGSMGTSLFIRAVYCLNHPFHSLTFGSPFDVQKSVSAGITVFRLWRKVVELQKGNLRPKAGAKQNPKLRGNFLTYGCELAAEIHFAAATLYNLCLFLHFNGLGPSWSSLYLTGTTTTERIIGELQGKTIQMQCLNSQPTFSDMLDRFSVVQFNQHVEEKLGIKGVKIAPTINRKKSNYKFQLHSEQLGSSYRYPETYGQFLDEQRQAHAEGSKFAHDLFEKYCPKEAVNYLKSNNVWHKPYTFHINPDMKVVDEQGVPANYKETVFSLFDLEGHV